MSAVRRFKNCLQTNDEYVVLLFVWNGKNTIGFGYLLNLNFNAPLFHCGCPIVFNFAVMLWTQKNAIAVLVM